MADIEKLRRRAPNNRIFQRFLDLGLAGRAKTFLACEMVVSFGTAGALLGLMGALICAVGAWLGVIPSGLAGSLLLFGVVNMVAADTAGYAIWRMMRAEPELAKDTRADFGPMVWLLAKEGLRFAPWNLQGTLAGQHGRCQARLRLNKRGEAGLQLNFSLAVDEAGITSRSLLGRWEQADAASYTLQFGESSLRLERRKSGEWRFAAGAGRDALAEAWGAPLDELVLN
jgi:hypothetical protein